MQPTYVFSVLDRYIADGFYVVFMVEGTCKKKKYQLCLTSKVNVDVEATDEECIEWIKEHFNGLDSAYAHINTYIKE